MNLSIAQWRRSALVLSTGLLGAAVGFADSKSMQVAPTKTLNTISQTGIHQSDIHVIHDETNVLADETSLHMDAARLADSTHDYKNAAEELRRVQAHVQSQISALQNVNNRFTGLITDTAAGKVSPDDLDAAFLQARRATDGMHNWIPLSSQEVDIFMPEMDYHLARARQELKAGDQRAASQDVRRAASYLRLRENVLTGAKAGQRDTLKKAETSLETLATEIQNGKNPSAQRIDSEFGDAAKAWNGSF